MSHDVLRSTRLRQTTTDRGARSIPRIDTPADFLKQLTAIAPVGTRSATAEASPSRSQRSAIETEVIGSRRSPLVENRPVIDRQLVRGFMRRLDQSVVVLSDLRSGTPRARFITGVRAADRWSPRSSAMVRPASG